MIPVCHLRLPNLTTPLRLGLPGRRRRGWRRLWRGRRGAGRSRRRRGTAGSKGRGRKGVSVYKCNRVTCLLLPTALLASYSPSNALTKAHLGGGGEGEGGLPTGGQAELDGAVSGCDEAVALQEISRHHVRLYLGGGGEGGGGRGGGDGDGGGLCIVQGTKLKCGWFGRWADGSASYNAPAWSLRRRLAHGSRQMRLQETPLTGGRGGGGDGGGGFGLQRAVGSMVAGAPLARIVPCHVSSMNSTRGFKSSAGCAFTVACVPSPRRRRARWWRRTGRFWTGRRCGRAEKRERREAPWKVDTSDGVQAAKVTAGRSDATVCLSLR